LIALAGCSGARVTSPEELAIPIAPPHWKVRLHTGLLHLDTKALNLDPRKGGDLGAELIWNGMF
jgi:hypothetical protein